MGFEFWMNAFLGYLINKFKLRATFKFQFKRKFGFWNLSFGICISCEVFIN